MCSLRIPVNCQKLHVREIHGLRFKPVGTTMAFATACFKATSCLETELEEDWPLFSWRFQRRYVILCPSNLDNFSHVLSYIASYIVQAWHVVDWRVAVANLSVMRSYVKVVDGPRSWGRQVFAMAQFIGDGFSPSGMNMVGYGWANEYNLSSAWESWSSSTPSHC